MQFNDEAQKIHRWNTGMIINEISNKSKQLQLLQWAAYAAWKEGTIPVLWLPYKPNSL